MRALLSSVGGGCGTSDDDDGVDDGASEGGATTTGAGTDDFASAGGREVAVCFGRSSRAAAFVADPEHVIMANNLRKPRGFDSGAGRWASLHAERDVSSRTRRDTSSLDVREVAGGTGAETR